MELTLDPIPYVLSTGDTEARLHLLQLSDMSEEDLASDLMLDLMKGQMLCGGFPSKFDGRTPGVRETCRAALLVLRCRTSTCIPTVQGALNFLLEHQSETEGWSENPELELPAHVIELSTKECVTWLTADVVQLLREAGLEESPACQRALSWLKWMQNDKGGWGMFLSDRGSDPDSSAQITFLMGDLYGESDPVYTKGRELFEVHLSDCARDAERGYYVAPSGERRENDIYHLTHLLLSSLVDLPRRIEAGYNMSDARVVSIMREIIRTQRSDGGWAPFWSEESDPTYTVLAVKLLTQLGVVDLSWLKDTVLRHLKR